MSSGRLETFADGVIAIAATLLILNVDTQIESGGRGLAAQLLHIWPSYIGYAVSFLTIGIIWVNHHTLMNQIGQVDRPFLLLNVFLLLCVAFIPFPTRLVAENIRTDGARAAALTYGTTLTATAVMFSGVWFYAAIGRRPHPGRCGPSHRQRHHQELSSGSLDPSRRYAHRPGQPDRQRHPVWRHCTFLRGGEFALRPEGASLTVSSHEPGVIRRVCGQLRPDRRRLRERPRADGSNRPGRPSLRVPDPGLHREYRVHPVFHQAGGGAHQAEWSAVGGA